MDLILEQFPIVFKSLNIGFLQTLKLFFVTLLDHSYWILASAVGSIVACHCIRIDVAV